jgi:hypothetical protein
MGPERLFPVLDRTRDRTEASSGVLGSPKWSFLKKHARLKRFEDHKGLARKAKFISARSAYTINSL